MVRRPERTASTGHSRNDWRCHVRAHVPCLPSHPLWLLGATPTVAGHAVWNCSVVDGLRSRGCVDWEIYIKHNSRRFWIDVSVGNPGFGITVKKTLPSAPGGRKPARGSFGGWLVVGSRDWNVQLRILEAIFREALILTSRFVVGRRSKVAV